MIYRTNSKIPPLEQSNRPANFNLSIKSKPRPFLLSHSKPHNHQQIEQEFRPESSFEEPQVFPVQIYKDMLIGQKIYLETYYKDQLYDSGYEPYIIAMGGEVTKRLCPSTTVVLTSLMSRERYNKLKAKVQKTCKPTTYIMSIVWLQEIYRQKRKVQKEDFLFNQITDIIDDPVDSDDDSMPDYFERQIFQNDFNEDLEQFMKIFDKKISFKIQDNKKFKDRLGEDFLDFIEPKKYELFSQFDEDQFKILKNRKGYKYFWLENKEKQKKRNKPGTSVGNRKLNPEKEKKPRTSIIKKPEIRKTERPPRSDSFDDSSFQIDKKIVPVKPPSRRTIDKEEIQNYREQKLYIPTKSPQFKNAQNNKNEEKKNQNNGKYSKKITNETQKVQQRKFTDIGKLKPVIPEKKKNKKEKGTDTSNQSKMSDAEFIKRNRQKNENQTLEALFSKMMSKSRVGSKKQQNKQPSASNSNSMSMKSMSQPSRSTPAKSQSDINEVRQKTITAAKNSKFR